MEDVCRVSRGCIKGVWKVYGWCLEPVWRVSVMCLEGIRRVVKKFSGTCLESVWRVAGRFMTKFFLAKTFLEQKNLFDQKKGP